VSEIPSVFLKPGRDRRVSGGHPWAFSNEIRMDSGAKSLDPGCIATLKRVDGKPLGTGTFNPHSLIAFRIFARQGPIGRDFIADRLRRALKLRERLFEAPHYRLINGEADGLPGLVVDRFGDVAVVQARTRGTEALLDPIVEAIDEVIAPTAVVLRNDGAWRQAENLDTYVRVAKGDVNGPVPVIEGDLKFLADAVAGQKTGWFFDQRPNRAFVAGLSRGGGAMLDVFCYSGGFALGAVAAGASEVLAIDRSGAALDLARQAAADKGLGDRCTFTEGDAFTEMGRLAKEGAEFSVVACDPPAFVKSKSALKSGLKGYRKLARAAARLVQPGGYLFLASCSLNVDRDSFTAEVAKGIAGAGREGRIIYSAGAGPDHPVHPKLPDSATLKALVLHLD
jgi:23S rRNA (cytosine1962-C5)-methyltransferase